MELLHEIIEKTRHTRDLVEIHSHDEASLAIASIEELLDQLPAGVEDWAHALLQESKLFHQAKEWMHRDHYLAMEKLDEAIERLEEINAEAQARHTPPEFPEDLTEQPTTEPAKPTPSERINFNPDI